MPNRLRLTAYKRKQYVHEAMLNGRFTGHSIRLFIKDKYAKNVASETCAKDMREININDVAYGQYVAEHASKSIMAEFVKQKLPEINEQRLMIDQLKAVEPGQQVPKPIKTIIANFHKDDDPEFREAAQWFDAMVERNSIASRIGKITWNTANLDEQRKFLFNIAYAIRRDVRRFDNSHARHDGIRSQTRSDN